MANQEHLAILKKGVEVWNQWRIQNPYIRLDIFGSDLAGVNLSGAVRTGVNLHGTNLSGANLRESNLTGAILSEADLGGVNLQTANLSVAILWGASLRGANLIGANLTGANLWRADFTGAEVGYTTFANVDLSGVKGLEAVVHTGPSSIGIDTIYKSKGQIPHVFLRGAGVPDNFIEYMVSLVGTVIEFYSLFISYSTQDQEFAERLHADLQAKGVRCWFAPHKLQGGKKLHEQIDEAIRFYDKLLLILSPDSMDSEWVKAEIFKAREREVKEGKRVLFPIRLCSFEALRDWKLIDGDTGKDLAREIREFHIPDFSNWKDHDAYKKAFDRLLEDLHGKRELPSS
ncbi:MAG TPA: toll/interleukin-1 receptor domain-containing protein [Terracidiphilus sp.]|nr:toll/interleukin-1 receptor domain-containing protein [Terracidiphilus sp.]